MGTRKNTAVVADKNDDYDFPFAQRVMGNVQHIVTTKMPRTIEKVRGLRLLGIPESAWAEPAGSAT
jgi:hypothetical protein